MRIRFLAFLLLLLVGGMTYSLIRGQERLSLDGERPASAGDPSAHQPADAGRSPSHPDKLTHGSAQDFSKLDDPFTKEMVVSCQRGGEWLWRSNDAKGHFLFVRVPALNSIPEGDNYLREAGAAFALARAARVLGEDRYAARAAQAILTLLDDTIVDSGEVKCRHTLLPSSILNRLGAAGLLVLAINELPSPQADLLDKSEQLCNWIRHQACDDGSLRCDDSSDESHLKWQNDVDSVNEHPGLALYALLRSQKHRPDAWKTELARKALVYYREWWKQHRSMAFVPWQTAAWAEAYVQTKEPAFAEFVYEMNDWLCGLQYEQLDPRRPLWNGGFMKWSDSKAIDAAPTIGSAIYAEGLVQARRAARAGSDPARYQHYTEVLHRCLQFLVRLQYNEANTQHFEEWYRPRLVGGFHASIQDGNLRIDYSQHALSALAMYLEDLGG
ncbi:MAG TPA: hypothetical protein VMF69_12110 [Gemmataceae bacterium]|nr:hypothetical protein [Gemmataceae bacterium]